MAKFEKIGAGSILEDMIGNRMMVVERYDDCAWLKYINEDGELSRGSVFAVPSHFEKMTVVELRER